MSNSSLSKVARTILQDLQASANKGTKSARKQLERQDGQILIINRKRFMDNLIGLVPSIAGPSNRAIRDEIWNTFSTRLRGLERFIPADRLNELKIASKSIVGKKTHDHVFFIKRYRSALRAKGYVLKKIIKDILVKRDKNPSLEELQNLSKIGGSSNKFGAQLGHAEHINGVHVGFAASTARVAAAKEKISRLTQSSDKATFMKGISEYENTMKVTIDHTQIVDSKGIKKKYIPIISWQSAVSNQELSSIEQAALKSFQDYLQNIVDNPGSASLKEALEMAFLHELSTGGKKLKKKVVGKKKQRSASRGKGSARQKIKTKKVNTIIRDNTVPKTIGRAKRNTPDPSPSSQVLALIGILNARLPDQVAGNMNPPALQYQTGRFANSVRVTDVMTTAQGYPSIGYTYQRYPYETFEPGNLQGSIERDPRRLIDKSIREIAAEFTLGRFYTRRT